MSLPFPPLSPTTLPTTSYTASPTASPTAATTTLLPRLFSCASPTAAFPSSSCHCLCHMLACALTCHRHSAASHLVSAASHVFVHSCLHLRSLPLQMHMQALPPHCLRQRMAYPHMPPCPLPCGARLGTCGRFRRSTRTQHPHLHLLHLMRLGAHLLTPGRDLLPLCLHICPQWRCIHRRGCGLDLV